MKFFLLELIYKATETFVVEIVTLVTTAIVNDFIAKCKDKRKKKTTPRPRKQKRGSKKKK